jgi:23S rRNA (guanosine2251-2'-O)-methyltransferase
VTPEQDSYAVKKAFYDRVLTVYGRKPALEALRDESLECHTLHLANSNKQAGIIAQLRDLAESRGIAVRSHSRKALAHISRNARQDQGVALDIVCPAFQGLTDYLRDLPGQPPRRLLALDGVSNPQNLGMIIRSAAAGGIDGIVYARKGNAALGPLVIKASAGTVYRAPLLRCNALPEALAACRDHGAQVCTLQADATRSLFAHQPQGHCVFVLGNETTGVSPAVSGLADTALAIPMSNGVESLNVAVTASLIAYAHYLER